MCSVSQTFGYLKRYFCSFQLNLEINGPKCPEKSFRLFIPLLGIQTDGIFAKLRPTAAPAE